MSLRRTATRWKAPVVAVAVAAAALVTANPAAARTAAPSPGSASTFTVTLTDKTSTGVPSTVTPGFHSFVLKQGAKDHRDLEIVLLRPGYTAATFLGDYKKSNGRQTDLKAFRQLTAKSKVFGGLQSSADKDFTATGKLFTVPLEPGSYVLLNSPDDAGPAANLTAFTVTGSSTGTKPTTDGTFVSREFSYSTSGIRAGLHNYAFHNGGSQIHMLLLIKVDSGYKESDVLKALQQSDGPPPSWLHSAGYAGVLSPGATMWTTFRLAHAHYELLCFMPDLKTGAPHFVLGMHKFLSL